MNTSESLVSVIMPVYNAESSLRASIESVLSQTYTDWELILVNDGSTDGSGAICDEYAEKDGRVRVVHKANGGVSSARNAGLAAAKGFYISWLDSDDCFKPTILEKLLLALRAHGKQVAMCNYKNITISGEEQIRYKNIPEDRIYPRETMMGFILASGLTPVLWGNIMERTLYEGIQFPEGKLFEDVRSTYKLHERADGAVMLIEPLLIRTQHRSSLSRVFNLSNRVDGNLSYIERYNDAVQRWPQYGQSMLAASARTLRILRNNILLHPLKAMKYRDELKRIGGFYRSHTAEILPKDANLLFRLEFRGMTAGNYIGFAFSMAIDILAGKPHSYLKHLKTPNLPPY